jgi:transcriptional regulator with GAF, ATPase, and Fis domain
MQTLSRKQQVEEHGGLQEMVGTSQAMRRVFEQIRLVASSNCTVLVTGESSTGKDWWPEPFIVVRRGRTAPSSP